MHVQHISGLDDLDLRSVVVIFVFEGEEVISEPLGHESNRLVSLAASEGLRTREFEPTLLRSDSGGRTLLLMGAGERDDFESLALMRAAASASKFAVARGFSHLAFVDPSTHPPFETAHAIVEGAIRGSYDPGLKKTRASRRRSLEEVTLIADLPETSGVEAGMELGRVVGETSCEARDLVNLPPNDLTPTAFAARAESLGRELGLDVTVLDEQSIRELGMGAILGVAAGSRQPPTVIVLRYGDSEADVKLAMVGKGITFDSGGLSIKTAHGMQTMKGDMGGGAAVLGGMLAIARLAPQNISVTGYIGATENMPGDNAMRPGDILTAFNGETIEVLDTDCEGRLVLADLLAYAESEGATHIVDFATLTGGATVALGTAASLTAGRPREWVETVVDAAAEGLERVWPMPLYPEYRKAMNSDFADIKNTGGRLASPLTAAAFLSDFVSHVPWAHVDIAGTSFVDDARAYAAKGGTGVGVATIVAIVRRFVAMQAKQDENGRQDDKQLAHV